MGRSDSTSNTWGRIVVTLLFWFIARIIPGVISSFDPNDITLRSIAFLIMLPLGWYAAKITCKKKHPRCIRINLYIVACLEGLGLLELLPMLINVLSSTGRYSTDYRGISYSQYPSIFLTVIGWTAIYSGLCIILAKATPSPKPQIPNIPAVPADLPELKAWKYEDGCVFAMFQSGKIYKYVDVPYEIYCALCNSPKKSQFLFEFIVGKFRAEQVSS